jgi:hypothetical protein
MTRTEGGENLAGGISSEINHPRTQHARVVPAISQRSLLLSSQLGYAWLGSFSLRESFTAVHGSHLF